LRRPPTSTPAQTGDVLGVGLEAFKAPLCEATTLGAAAGTPVGAEAFKALSTRA